MSSLTDQCWLCICWAVLDKAHRRYCLMYKARRLYRLFRLGRIRQQPQSTHLVTEHAPK
jgi:hypothetical protein